MSMLTNINLNTISQMLIEIVKDEIDFGCEVMR
jgi:hypothetical protein